tara:strand:+ start:71 stop:967 length:897 start_codon:yes stop_codon:yes gene_type:complete
MAYLDPAELRKEFGLSGFDAIAETAIADSKSAIALKRNETDDASIGLGKSKLGGDPDLPTGTDWPTWKGRPLAFLCQINLAEAPLDAIDLDLPRTGTLSFFADYQDTPWGYDPDDAGSAVVLANLGDSEIRRVPTPANAIPDDLGFDGDTFVPCEIQFEQVATYRVPDESVMTESIKSQDDIDEFYDLVHRTLLDGQGDENPHHQIGGHALTMQNAMELECQLVTNGIYCGDELSAEDQKRAEELSDGAKDWVLLLQLDTDDPPGWMWSDMGMLYFWIRKQDLAARDFSKVWCVLQGA